MSTGRNWREVKAEARERHPEMADPARVAAADLQLDAFVAGHHLKELRKSLGRTQKEIAGVLGISQSRVSQIENGKVESMELETLRAYAAALGGYLDVSVRVGPRSVRVA
jgi:DNA-binding XRE family transcriptional regulator